ncbi:3119_t:CDS:2 [Gigaspora margarita]|uniref:3119_t:CDS:1 n=1 Tax=Gigaspora margarita TaxID=4874 RepID=A0ABM8W302_GIGMA|nr:3119_t:CDS:2 [Gigaspora margarita]
MIAYNALQAQFISNNGILPTYRQNLLKYIENNNLDITQAPIFISEFTSATKTKLYKAIKIYDLKQLPTSDNNLANYSNEVINILGNFIE